MQSRRQGTGLRHGDGLHLCYKAATGVVISIAHRSVLDTLSYHHILCEQEIMIMKRCYADLFRGTRSTLAFHLP